ncbi:hypothetical protein [Paraflavitalea speifideaquila]|uniref:hypothetical protein n=1 Tax=Paraflavitalea speifideaquila TaxID=3076558 RepID=UPI0028F0931E|nr:hypothetical protein [Paraflavitalea speifideiaquila]
MYQVVDTHKPVAIIYNYHPSTMPWLTRKVVHNFRLPLNRKIKVPQISIRHEVTQHWADRVDNTLLITI